MKKRILVIGVVILVIVVAIGIWLPHEFKEEKTEKLNLTLEIQLGQPLIINRTTNEVYVGEKLPYREAIPSLYKFLGKGEEVFIFWTYYVPEKAASGYKALKDFEEGRIKECSCSNAFASISYERKINETTYQIINDFIEEGETKNFNGIEIFWKRTLAGSGYGLTNNENEWVLVLEITISFRV